MLINHQLICMGMLFTMFCQTHPASSGSHKFCLKHDRHVLYLAVEDNKDDSGGEHVDEDDTIQKEVGSAT